MKKENKGEAEAYDFESSIVLPTDAMGREIWWQDAGRPD